MSLKTYKIIANTSERNRIVEFTDAKELQKKMKFVPNRCIITFVGDVLNDIKFQYEEDGYFIEDPVLEAAFKRSLRPFWRYASYVLDQVREIEKEIEYGLNSSDY